MRKKLEAIWVEIFEDYYCGLSTRELERKYFDLHIRTIQRTCKSIMIELLTNPSSTMRQNWNETKDDILDICYQTDDDIKRL